MEFVACPAIVVLTGASGAGKTTLVQALNELGIHGVQGFNCDRVLEEVRASTDGADLQAKILRHWIAKLCSDRTQLLLAVLDTQIAPHRAMEVLNEAEILHSQIVLVDCDTAIRNERLIKDRDQPELANPQMDCWAAYLRGQSDALGLPRIDTTDGEGIAQLQSIINELMVRARTG